MAGSKTTIACQDVQPYIEVHFQQSHCIPYIRLLLYILSVSSIEEVTANTITTKKFIIIAVCTEA